MCGILCSILTSPKAKLDFTSQDISSIIRRGPDSISSYDIKIDENCHLFMCGTVLHMRGDLCSQPLQNDVGDALLWNGEIFGGIEVSPTENDGQVLLDQLTNCKNEQEIMNIFQRLQGPYAFVYYKKSQNKLIFGRDVFGRRSLTFYKDMKSNSLYISSVSIELDVVKPQHWTELPAAGIFTMSLNSDDVSQMKCYSWTHNDMNFNHEDIEISVHSDISLYQFGELNLYIPEECDIPEQLETSAEPLTLAASWLEPQCNKFLSLLKTAVYKRVVQHSYYCQLCTESHADTLPVHSHISIMFSGGIDSMLLAYLADQCVPSDQPIDLLNVAFETGSTNNFNVPDRVTGHQALAELNPNRQWNFVEVNVTKNELQCLRTERISQLILPLDSVLDDSIGCAMWFASRGEGVIRDSQGNTTPHCSKARIVLSGLGADEQLGGYSRHRSSYQNKGWMGLLEEINTDIRRVSARNLGRDDRVISDHSKESRFPFLDEDVVSYLNQLPIHQKMYLKLPRGTGEKLLLRACAHKCGLMTSCSFAKRAIQFGSRIAKCENSKEKGSDKCERLVKDNK